MWKINQRRRIDAIVEREVQRQEAIIALPVDQNAYGHSLSLSIHQEPFIQRSMLGWTISTHSDLQQELIAYEGQ